MVEVARSGIVGANAISPSAISQHQMTIKIIESEYVLTTEPRKAQRKKHSSSIVIASKKVIRLSQEFHPGMSIHGEVIRARCDSRYEIQVQPLGWNFPFGLTGLSQQDELIFW
jgi:hypothetical protein